MKYFRMIPVLLASVLLLFLQAPPVKAIGFNPEELFGSVCEVYSGGSWGSGFAVGENCIISNAHVIEDWEYIEVYTIDGEWYEAEIYAIDRDLDLVVLQIAEGSLPVMRLADPRNSLLGSDVYAIGAPEGYAYSVTKGILSARERDFYGFPYLQSDVAINGGSSGGPLLNERGEAIGVNTLSADWAQGLSFAIPMYQVVDFLERSGVPLDGQGNVVGRIERTEPLADPFRERLDESLGFVARGVAVLMGGFAAMTLLAGGSIVLGFFIVNRRNKG